MQSRQLGSTRGSGQLAPSPKHSTAICGPEDGHGRTKSPAQGRSWHRGCGSCPDGPTRAFHKPAQPRAKTRPRPSAGSFPPPPTAVVRATNSPLSRRERQPGWAEQRLSAPLQVQETPAWCVAALTQCAGHSCRLTGHTSAIAAGSSMPSQPSPGSDEVVDDLRLQRRAAGRSLPRRSGRAGAGPTARRQVRCDAREGLVWRLRRPATSLLPIAEQGSGGQ